MFDQTLICLPPPEAKTPPTFPKKITSLQQTEGQPVRFECRIAGSSPIEVTWLKDGEPLGQGAEVSMTYDDNTAVLHISRSEMRHSGEYSCVATNSVGSASCRAKLTLQGQWRSLMLRRPDWSYSAVLFLSVTLPWILQNRDSLQSSIGSCRHRR